MGGAWEQGGILSLHTHTHTHLPPFPLFETFDTHINFIYPSYFLPSSLTLPIPDIPIPSHMVSPGLFYLYTILPVHLGERLNFLFGRRGILPLLPFLAYLLDWLEGVGGGGLSPGGSLFPSPSSFTHTEAGVNWETPSLPSPHLPPHTHGRGKTVT